MTVTVRYSVSGFLRMCAQHIAARQVIDRNEAPSGWVKYVALTLPPASERWSDRDIVRTRVMRFLLAAAIAEGEGQ